MFFEFLFTIRFLLALLQACRLNNTTCRFSNGTCLVWFALFYFVCGPVVVFVCYRILFFGSGREEVNSEEKLKGGMQKDKQT